MTWDQEQALEEYRRRIGRAMNYICDHLDENPSLDDIARAASFSKFHFHRLFGTVVGETVAQFIRRVRLERAAHMLIYERRKDVTTIAIECGFSSSQNFAKAFGKHFAQTPTAFRRQFSKDGNMDRKDENALARDLSYASSSVARWRPPDFDRRNAMDVKIETMPAMHVAYVRNIGPYGPQGCGGAFEKLMTWAGPRGLCGRGPTLGVCWDNPQVTPPEKCRYDACLCVEPGTQTQGEVGLQEIPGGQYAVYHVHIRTDQFPQAWDELICGWLPGSGYQPGEGPCYEYCLNDGREDPQGLWDVKICCPVKPL